MIYSLILKSKQNFMWHQFLVFLAALAAPIVPAIVTTGVLITVDFATGLWAARKAKEPITSRRMRDTVDKIFVYNMTIVLAYLIEIYMVKGTIPVLRIALGFISFAEFKSISENFHKISGINLFKKIKTYLKKKHDIEI